MGSAVVTFHRIKREQKLGKSQKNLKFLFGFEIGSNIRD
jgi:hypothetical protein